MKADAPTEQAVLTTLHQLTEAYADRDLSVFMCCFAPDADVMLYGTGEDEKRCGLLQIRAQVERDWEQTEQAQLHFDWISVSAADPVAWLAADGAFLLRVAGQKITLPTRLTMVLEQRDNRWFIMQAHFSTPSVSQEEGHAD